MTDEQEMPDAIPGTRGADEREVCASTRSVDPSHSPSSKSSTSNLHACSWARATFRLE